MTRTIIAGLSALFFLLLTSFTIGATRTEIADAAMKGDKAALRTLIEQKNDVNAAQTDGATAVHWAVYRDDLEMLDMLIKAGARVDVANREGVALGEIVGVVDHGAHPLLEVARADGGAHRLIPYVASIVDSVDLAARRIDVDWGEEW